MNQPVPASAPQRFDRNALATTMQSQGGRGVSFAPTDFVGLLEVANLMAASGQAVPKHLRGNPGMCLSIAMVAYQNEFNPYLLSGDTYVVNDILAYGAKSIAAIVNNSPKLEQRLLPIWTGEWPNRRCTVTGRIKGQKQDHEIEIKAETITVRNSPLWKTQPDIQLAYYSQRAWCRLYMPETLLGLLSSDEVHEMRDITPERPARTGYRGPQDDQPLLTSAEVEAEDELGDDQGGEGGGGETVSLFELVTEDGEAREFEQAGDWADALYNAFKGASSLDAAKGLWETNSSQLQRLRDEHEKGAGLADAIEKAYGAAFEKFNPRKPAQTQAPQQAVAPVATQVPQAAKGDRLNAPRDLGKIPTRESGGFDWFTAAKVLGEAIATSASQEDVTAWQQRNMRWIEGIQNGASPQYAALQKTIQATREILGGTEA